MEKTSRFLGYLVVGLRILVGVIIGLVLDYFFGAYAFLVLVSSLVIFVLGYVMGESNEKRMERRCFGKEHVLKETGWDYQSRKEGRGSFYCDVCGTSFDENKNAIPRVVNDVLFERGMARSYPFAKKDWKQIEKYLVPVFCCDTETTKVGTEVV